MGTKADEVQPHRLPDMGGVFRIAAGLKRRFLVRE
jgi:hypothetical protein